MCVGVPVLGLSLWLEIPRARVIAQEAMGIELTVFFSEARLLSRLELLNPLSMRHAPRTETKLNFLHILLGPCTNAECLLLRRLEAELVFELFLVACLAKPLLGGPVAANRVVFVDKEAHVADYLRFSHQNSLMILAVIVKVGCG